MIRDPKALMDGIPEPDEDTLDVFVEMDEEDVHFLDDIVKSYDGVANVRREYRVHKGQKQFRILVSPDFLDELQGILSDLRRYIYVGEIQIEGPSNGC